MAPLPYREIGSALADTRGFTGNTMSARWVGTGPDRRYVVYSYGTRIAEYNPGPHPDHGTTVTDTYYSRTTAKHVGYCLRYLPAIRSNDPAALEGIGTGCRVKLRPGIAAGPLSSALTYMVRDVYPLSGRIVVTAYGQAARHLHGPPDSYAAGEIRLTVPADTVRLV